jgi:uncharacterized protein YgiM (DUF1202 family)
MEFHIKLAKDTGQPTFGKNTAVIFVLVILAVLVSVGSGREAAARPGRAVPAGGAKVSVPSFPYVAEITGDNVNVRSGRGTNYYSCGKLNKGDRVKVVNHQLGWSCIVPPAGSFSWISKQYIGIDLDNPTVGIVTGDGVRVYAGSDLIKPMHSTTLQRKVNWGDKVELLGEVKENYHKIAPPAGAYLWVSTQYTKAVDPAKEVKPTIVKPPTTTVSPPTTTVKPPKVVRPDISAEAALIQYYALEKLIEAERVKPIAQQNYANIKKTLTEIVGSKKAGKAARYSTSALKLVERYEWAFKVEKDVRLQDAELQRILEGINKARIIRLAEEVENLGRFAVIGQLETFVTYGPGHYRIIDNSGKTICYALPTGLASKMDLSKLVGRKVGLVGTIQPHPQTSGAVVRFIKTVELQ